MVEMLVELMEILKAVNLAVSKVASKVGQSEI